MRDGRFCRRGSGEDVQVVSDGTVSAPARHDKMVELVERMLMRADSLQLTANGPDED